MEAGFHLHAPKTGGTSIIAALMTHSETFSKRYGHFYARKEAAALSFTPASVPDDICYCPDHKLFITFGIRNPYDRMLSLTKQLNRQNKILENGRQYTLKTHFTEIKRYSKIDWSDSLARYKDFAPHWSVTATLNDFENTLCPNCEIKYIRFENFVEDFKSLYPFELEHWNNHKQDDPTTIELVKQNFDSQETLDKFNEYYAKDFSRYDYAMITNLNDLYQKYQNNS